MNQHLQPNPDAELREKLRLWQVDAPLPPGFRDRVWRRIAAAESRAPARWRQWLSTFEIKVRQPRFAAAALALFLLAGLTGGWLQAQHVRQGWNHDLQTRYVRSVDPYQLPTLAHSTHSSP